MNIELIKSKISLKASVFEKVINKINFEHCNEENAVAFLRGTIIFYTDKLFLNFSEEEQLFIIAHEIMHYIRHCMTEKNDISKYKDEELLNFVEDAQINQILLKFGFISPSDVILLNDALEFTEDELYSLLFPRIIEIKGMLRNITDWKNFSSTSDILNCTKLKSSK